MFLLVYLLILLVTGWMTWQSYRLGDHKIASVVSALSLLERSTVLMIILMIGPWLLVFVGMDLFEREGIWRSSLIQIPALCLCLLWSSVILTAGTPLPRIKESLGKMVLVVLSLGMSLFGAEVVLRKNPAMIPNAARPHLAGGGLFLRQDLLFDNPPITVGFRYLPNQDYWVSFSDENRDLYGLSGGPSKEQGFPQGAPLETIHFVTDKNGYPNTSPLTDHYNIVTTGDSFSAAGWVPTPWPQVLGRLRNEAVLNLSIPMYGPQSESAAVKQFGLTREPKWVIVGYFEGNDLLDALLYNQVQQSRYSWVDYTLHQGGLLSSIASIQTLRFGFPDALSRVLAGLRPQSDGATQSSGGGHFSFAAGGKHIPLAFNANYLSMLTSSREDIRASVNFRLTTQAFLNLKQECEDEGARLILVFFPSKEHTYLPLIDDHALANRLLADVPAQMLNQDGRISDNGGRNASMQLILDHNNDQRDLVSEFAEANGIAFLDLTTAFRDKAREGAELYYEWDTHWNQNGHDLAGEIIHRFVLDLPQD